MSYVASFREGVAGWVHENARMHPREFARHSDFISTRLAAAIAPLALAPAYIALRGTLELWESLIFVCAALPLASVYLLSRTGNFVAAQAMSIAGLLAASVVLSFGLGGISAAALVGWCSSPSKPSSRCRRRWLSPRLSQPLQRLPAFLLQRAWV